MPNYVQAIRQAILAIHPEAVVSERRRSSIIHRIASAPDGRQRFVLDVVIGSLHYGLAQDQEINTDWLPTAAPWNYEMLAADYNARLVSRFDAGMIARYIDPYTAEYVEFQPQNLQYSNDLDQIQPIGIPQNVNAAITGNTAYWTGAYGTGRDFTWTPTPDRLEKWLRLLTPASLPMPTATTRNGGNPVVELNIVFRRSAGVELWIDGAKWNEAANNPKTTANRIEFRQTSTGTVLWWIDLPQTVDAAGEQVIGSFRLKKQGPSLYVSIRVPLSWIEDAARVWPISIDTTVVDKQVAASADDCLRALGGNLWVLNSTFVQAGDIDNNFYDYRSGMRWLGITIPNGATIDTAYLQLQALVGLGPIPTTYLDGEAADNAATFSTAGNYDGRTRTSASVTWTPAAWVGGTWYNSTEAKTIIKEIVDRVGWASGNALVLFWRDTTGWGGVESRIVGNSWDKTGNVSGPKLHIEYTAGGAPQILTPSAVGLSLSAPTPGVALTLSLTPSAGTLQLTAPAGAVTLTLTLTPSAATLSLTAPAPALSFGAITKTPDAVAVTLMPEAPTVSLTFALAPGAVPVALTAPAPTVSLTLTFTPDAVGATLTAPAPTIGLSLALAPDTTALSLTVLAPSLVFGAKALSPDTVALALSAVSPALAFGAITKTPDTVALTLAAEMPALAFGVKTLMPDAVALLLATETPTLALTLALTPNTIAMTLSLPSPVVAHILVLAPDAIAIVLSVPAPSLALAYALAPTAVAMLLVAEAPSLALGALTLTPNAVALAVSALAPSLALSLALTPTTAAMLLTALAPNLLFGGITRTPDTVALALNTPAPSLASVLTLTPSALAIVASIQSPTLGLVLALTPATVPANLAPPAPHLAYWQQLAPLPVSLALTLPPALIAMIGLLGYLRVSEAMLSSAGSLLRVQESPLDDGGTLLRSRRAG